LNAKVLKSRTEINGARATLRRSGFVSEDVRRGKKVYVYGASTKGNTMVQYFGLDRSLITAATERNPDKWGRVTLG
jgi:hypothetical protein